MGPISVTPQQVLGIRTTGAACYKLGRTPDVRLLCQQALLQLLVINHEQERKHLSSLLLSGVFLEDLQDQDCDLPKKEGIMILSPSSSASPNYVLLVSPTVSFVIPPPHTDCQERAALRNGCMKKMKTIHVDSQTHSQTPGVPHPELQAQRTTEPRPQQQLEERYLLLLSQLSELQEVEDEEVLSALIDGVGRRSGSV